MRERRRRISKGFGVDQIVEVIQMLCDFGESAKKEGDQLTTMGFNAEDVEVEGLITCYLTSMRAVRQFK